MEKESSESMESPSMMTYVVGAVLVVAVIAGAWYFRSKSNKGAMVSPTTNNEPAAMATPASTPITGLGCDQQWFNPKIGFNEYYLSASGGDASGAKSVSCAFTVKVDDKVVASATAQSPLSDAPQRNGSTFVCTSKALALDPSVKTTVEVALKDDLNATATCNADFTFPPQL